jgi:uncharacterized protein
VTLPESRIGGASPRSPLLLQLRSDRRLGHEWDDWDGEALPGGGDFGGGTGLFFCLAGMLGAMAAGVLGGLAWLVAPRLEGVFGGTVVAVWGGIAGGLMVWLAYLAAVYAVIRVRRPLLPRVLAEGGVIPWLLPRVEWLGIRLGYSRDRAGNAAMQVFNRLSAARAGRGVAPEKLLILLPRCLEKRAMRSAMEVSERYGVPAFVAARGRYARQMIAMRRPEAVVAVACERDLVSGVHDVGGRLPVMGTLLQLPEGPCLNTSFRGEQLEAQVRTLLGLGEGKGGERGG